MSTMHLNVVCPRRSGYIAADDLRDWLQRTFGSGVEFGLKVPTYLTLSSYVLGAKCFGGKRG